MLEMAAAESSAVMERCGKKQQQLKLVKAELESVCNRCSASLTSRSSELKVNFIGILMVR